METDTASRRARLVEALWRLKQSLDHSGEQLFTQRIHFNRLLNDPDYRDRVVEAALGHGDDDIRFLARQVCLLDQSGSALVGGRRQTTSSGRLNPDIAETLSASREESSGRGWGLYLLAILLCLAGGTWLLIDTLSAEWRALLNSEKVVSDPVTENRVWTADTTWILDDIIYVENGARLEIEPGTRILGRSGSALVVTRGAALHARGSADAPIVFTSAQPEGARHSGDWGGVVLLGSAPVNVAEARIEGLPDSESRAAYGGHDAAGSCGVLEYSRIEFAGYEISANNELNGLTLGGCGESTIIRNVQVHRALDDGIEVFGGTVNLKQVLITGAGDDSLDWDQGWRGKVQFLIAQQHANAGDNAFEGDNLKSDPEARPFSEPVMYNLTLLSPRSRERHHRAMTIRRGSGGHFHNLAMVGFSGEAVDLQGETTVARIERRELGFTGLLMDRIGGHGSAWFNDEYMDQDDDGGFDEAAWFGATERRARFGVDPKMPREAFSPGRPDFTPLSHSPLRNGALPPPQGEFWDEAADWVGAIRPGASRTWLDGWAAFPLQ